MSSENEYDESSGDFSGRIYTCSRCTHRWVARKKDGIPKNCPRCRSTVWMKDYRIFRCLRCDHSWGTAKGEPKRCPRCHSVRWNTPVKETSSRSRSRQMLHSVDPEAAKEVMERYADGQTCTEIAIATGLSFGDVYAIVSESISPENIAV